MAFKLAELFVDIGTNDKGLKKLKAGMVAVCGEPPKTPELTPEQARAKLAALAAGAELLSKELGLG